MPKKKPVKNKIPKKNSSIIEAVFSGERIYSNKKQAFALYQQSRFGEPKSGKILYSPTEALYLIEKNKMQVISGRKILEFEQLVKKLRKDDKKIETKYAVFKNMRQKGYIIKTALKFGAEFRVYDKGKKPGQVHAKWILYPVKESETLTWHNFSAKSRVAHSTKKTILMAIVDEEDDVTYYEVNWTKP